MHHLPCLIQRLTPALITVLAEFNNAGCLLISEVKYLLENRDKDAPDTVYVIRQYQPAVLSTSFRADIVSSYPVPLPSRPPHPRLSCVSQGIQQDSGICQDFCKIQHHRFGVGRPRVGLPSSSPFPPAAGTIVVGSDMLSTVLMPSH